MPPAITVVLPVRNAATTVTRAIESTLRALPAGGRMLVRSDGSTDDTAARIRAIADDRITIIEGRQTIGIARSANELLAAVETDLVARMDGDDVCLPWRFRAQLPLIERGADFAFTTTVSWFADSSVPRRFRPPKPLTISPRAAPLLLLLENGFGHPTLLARTDAMRRLDGYRDLPSEDYDLWIRAALSGHRIARCATPGVVYRRHSEQTTADADWQNARGTDERVISALEALGRQEFGSVPTYLRWRKAGYPADAVPPRAADELAEIVRRARLLGLHDRVALLSRVHQVRRRLPGTVRARAAAARV